MADDLKTKIKEIARIMREERQFYMREFGLDEDDANHVVFTLSDNSPDASKKDWEAAWKAVRMAWPEGDKTGERLVALLLHHVAVARDGAGQA